MHLRVAFFLTVVALGQASAARANPYFDRFGGAKSDGCKVELSFTLPVEEANSDLYLFRDKDPKEQPMGGTAASEGVQVAKLDRESAVLQKAVDVGSAIHMDMKRFTAVDEACGDGHYVYGVFWRADDYPARHMTEFPHQFRGWVGASVSADVVVSGCARVDCPTPKPPPVLCEVFNHEQIIEGGDLEATYPFGKVVAGASMVRIDWKDGNATVVGLKPGTALAEVLSNPPPGKRWPSLGHKNVCTPIAVRPFPKTPEERKRWALRIWT